MLKLPSNRVTLESEARLRRDGVGRNFPAGKLSVTKLLSNRVITRLHWSRIKSKRKPRRLRRRGFLFVAYFVHGRNMQNTIARYFFKKTINFNNIILKFYCLIGLKRWSILLTMDPVRNRGHGLSLTGGNYEITKITLRSFY